MIRPAGPSVSDNVSHFVDIWDPSGRSHRGHKLTPESWHTERERGGVPFLAPEQTVLAKVGVAVKIQCQPLLSNNSSNSASCPADGSPVPDAMMLPSPKSFQLGSKHPLNRSPKSDVAVLKTSRKQVRHAHSLDVEIWRHLMAIIKNTQQETNRNQTPKTLSIQLLTL